MTTLLSITDAIARNIAMNNDLLITLRGLSPELQKEFAPRVQELIERNTRYVVKMHAELDLWKGLVDVPPVTDYNTLPLMMPSTGPLPSDFTANGCDTPNNINY